MCLDIAGAMNYLHSFTPQIIHRDLKSLNLLLAQAVTRTADMPLVKVSDFGLARMKDADPGSEWDKMTKEAGTCHWMAPEVPTGRYTEKVDIFSYAMVLFEIMCREIPFEEVEGKDAVRLVVSGERPDMEAVPPDRPQKLEDLMVACWAQRPQDRPSFAEISDVLKSVEL
uniref:Protein kinase domain-containing protein n=1 Tax=Zooxanthella nutricula TaxID=1333877 RepID=A0A7S2PV19_9DINO|mmetsp:Transcript_67571/g.206953  ORF Transcript_67571/g.206953 Transcript_67571/m.206953 type:complete len:170 (+) Transcript_67571:2-511(+)